MSEVPTLLTDQERERFAAYLEQDAKSAEQIIAQMEKMPFGGGETFTKGLRTERAAALIIARKLRSLSSESI